MTDKSPDDRILEARHELDTIVSLLRSISTGHISCGDPIDGSVVTWLADKVEDAVVEIEEAEMARRSVGQ